MKPLILGGSPFWRFSPSQCNLLGALLLLAILVLAPVKNIAAETEKAFDPKKTRSVTVTAHLLSGVHDPSWKLNRYRIAELADRIDALTPITSDQPWEQPSKVGYRGFTIKVEQKGGADKEFFIYDNIIELGNNLGKRKDSEHSLENWLLKTAGNAITRQVRSTVRNEFKLLSKTEGTPVDGPVSVTLHIFSGVHDPSWDLTPEQAALLSNKIQALDLDSTKEQLELPSRVGYRGFSLKLKPETGPASEFYLYDNVLQMDQSLGRRTDTKHALEFWLLGTAGGSLKPGVKALAEKELKDLRSGKVGR